MRFSGIKKSYFLSQVTLLNWDSRSRTNGAARSWQQDSESASLSVLLLDSSRQLC